jgi:large subunit ribosomal protein L10
VLKTEKQEVVNRLKEKFQESASVICVDFRGINVEKITQFRRQIQETSGNYQVVKNTLARRAIEETSFKELNQFLVGPTGIVFCPGEPMESAKVIAKFVDETNGALQIKGGIVEGAVFDAKGIKKVATLPSHQELLAQFVAALQSPISGFVGTLEGIAREFVYTLQAIADKKSSEG